MSNANKVPVARILDAQDKELMAIRKVERDGNALVVRGKIFGAMPMVAKLTPEEARAALKLIDFRTFVFLMTMLFRRS
ncbi:hypothetical protein Saro_3430 (plasmid) [Novosphingobium aromaticivorans DSM 12444]|uniref:Uncharacterized protein n=1 Tax=Novosphingobium aromaticivorans (strain ATCC 700278 / DSM 12444 / CCUG 56034 / CIP 105152 / NBRC 16084 / F199) TaxID=279238 RepID=A4XEC9_NOVAD|nr:hypothetical protein [Novosphingobium aromaticivorans]ABP64290.1 hypothetical protein Saro_3430 [Novosphingobium aromaticivorans DSM 12444]SCY81115.1 hypothetical protein SAMN05660666_03019 [Novosphingobium aromaticivorans]